MLAQLLGTTSPRLHLSSSTSSTCRHPHTLQVCWWRHPCMRYTARPRRRRPKLPGGAGLSPVGRTRTAHSPAPCRMAATSTAVHKHGKTTVAPSVMHWYVNMFSLGACAAPSAAWRIAFRRQLPQTPAPKLWGPHV